MSGAAEWAGLIEGLKLEERGVRRKERAEEVTELANVSVLEGLRIRCCRAARTGSISSARIGAREGGCKGPVRSASPKVRERSRPLGLTSPSTPWLGLMKSKSPVDLAGTVGASTPKSFQGEVGRKREAERARERSLDPIVEGRTALLCPILALDSSDEGLGKEETWSWFWEKVIRAALEVTGRVILMGVGGPLTCLRAGEPFGELSEVCSAVRGLAACLELKPRGECTETLDEKEGNEGKAGSSFGGTSAWFIWSGCS